MLQIPTPHHVFYLLDLSWKYHFTTSEQPNSNPHGHTSMLLCYFTKEDFTADDAISRLIFLETEVCGFACFARVKTALFPESNFFVAAMLRLQNSLYLPRF